MCPTSLRFTAALLASLLLATTAAEAANIYKCRTKDGGVVVSNTPCAKGAEPDAKLSTGSGGAIAAFRTPCERVEATGAGLVQIASKLTPQQMRAVEAQAFGRLNSAGASRILAEIGRGGVLRVCAYFPGGDSAETLIESNGQVRHDGVVDVDDSAAPAAALPIRNGIEICTAQFEACRSRYSSVGVEREECISRIAICGAERQTDCCPKACFDAYWKPPFEHNAGLAAMQASAACNVANRRR